MFFFKRSISNRLIIVIVMLLVSFLSTTAYAVEPDLPKANKLSITPTPQPLEQPSIDTIYLPWLNKDNMESSVPQPIKPNQTSLTLNGYEIHTLTLRIQQSSDDARYHNYDGYQHTQTNDPIGEGGDGTPFSFNSVGWRFASVTIPPGATVLSARLSLVKHGDHWSDWNFWWQGQATDNAVTFSSDSHPANRSPHTVAMVQHSDNINHLDGIRYVLDDLAPIIQEIIDRPKWRPGNALAIIVKAYGGWDRKWWRTFDYDNDPNGPNVPELVIHYKVPLIPSNVILVDETATGANDGSSWTDAYTNLQTALAAATAGDEIWVAAGVYIPGSHRHDSFSLKNDVAIYGGFAGYEVARIQRDYTSNFTVLSGDMRGDDITDSYGIVTNTRNIIDGNSDHIINNENISSTAILDGFIITAGKANGGVIEHKVGGGMKNQKSNPTLRNLIIIGNFASLGGGMYNDESNPTLMNVAFIANTAFYYGHGGGLYNKGSNPALINVTFSGNSATTTGGGLYNIDTPWKNIESNPTLTNVTFTGNYARFGGGGMYNDEGDPTLTNVTFTKNSVEYTYSRHGGGLSTSRGNLTLTNVAFIENSAYLGGGMYIFRGNATLTNVTFTGNSARFGGGIYNDLYDQSVTLTNVTMWDNTATTSGNQIFGSGAIISQSHIEGSGGSGSGLDSYLGIGGDNNLDPFFTADFHLE